MARRPGVLAVAALCGLLWGVHGARDASAASPVISAAGPFFFDAQEASGSGAWLASVFSPDERNAPGALDREAAWQRYYAHLMAPTRSAPFLVLFTDDPADACGVASQEEEEEEDGDPPRDDAPRTAECHQLRETTAAVTRYVRGLVAAEGFPARELLPVVHISKQELPQAFSLHRVPSTPSLLWLPPRATGKLQRRAHRQTNFLALPSAPPVDVASVAQDVTGFLQRSYAQSGLGFPSSSANAAQPRGRGRSASAQRLPSVVDVAAHGQQDDSLAERIINTLPFLAIGLYALLTAAQHRAAVLKVVRSRFTWLVLAQGVLYVSLSGLLHSIIHRVGAFYAHPQYGVYFIHPSGRKQFFLEGLVNGGWSFAISFALFSIANVMPVIKSRFAREEIFRWSLLVVGVAYMGLHLVFTAKHPWLSR